MARLAANRYAEALFELAKEQGLMEVLTEQVNAVAQVFADNAELMELLTHPKITKEEKITVAENVFTDRVDSAVLGLLVVVIEKGRCSELPEIFEEFLSKSREFRRIGRAKVVSATPLSEAQRKAVEQKLLTQTSYVAIEMTYETDASLLGGMTIRIGDRVVDATVKSKLNKMAAELLKLQLSNPCVSES